MLEGAFSFRGRIGRLDFFLAELLMVPAVVLAVIVTGALVAMAQRSVASLVFFAILGVLMLFVACWYSLSLHVRRLRDIGWDPFVVIVGWIGVEVFDTVLAAKLPALALGPRHTAIGALVNIALSLALLFWPGRDPDDSAGGRGAPTPGPSRLATLGLNPAGTEPTQAAAVPMRTGVRTEFGRRGVR